MENFNGLNVFQLARTITIPVHVSHHNPFHIVAAYPWCEKAVKHSNSGQHKMRAKSNQGTLQIRETLATRVSEESLLFLGKKKHQNCATSKALAPQRCAGLHDLFAHIHSEKLLTP